MVKDYYLISDAAKIVEVESHVLRYWEDELKLPIKRNELGHRYYTKSDVERFCRIKELKEQGLQLKAIRMILKDGKLSLGTYQERENVEAIKNRQEDKISQIIVKEDNFPTVKPAESKEEKTRRLQWLLQQMIADAVKNSNQELCREIKDNLTKELDYQFRALEERDDMRESERIKREDNHFKKVDELLRVRSRKWKK